MKRFGSLAALLAVVLIAGACSRSSSPPAATGPTVTNGGGTTTPSGPGPGDFGTLKKVCGPGEASPTVVRSGRDSLFDQRRHQLRPRVRRPARAQPGAVRRGRSVREVVQRRGRHQRPQDHARRVRRRAVQLRRPDQEGVRGRLLPRRQRQRLRQQPRSARPLEVPPARDPHLHGDARGPRLRPHGAAGAQQVHAVRGRAVQLRRREVSRRRSSRSSR